MAAMSLVMGAVACLPAARAEFLQGSVTKDDAIMRINRPTGQPLQGEANVNRIARPAPSFTAQAAVPGFVDTSAFAPLAGRANQTAFNAGVVKSDAFKVPPPKKFDLGAEAGSKELVLAWERWHKQLSEAIYSRWSSRAREAGQASVRVEVTKNRTIRATILTSTGSEDFNEVLMDSISGLNGNPGLTFPTKSRRDRVAFEADYIAARNVRPGYSWVKNDYERVRDSW